MQELLVNLVEKNYLIIITNDFNNLAISMKGKGNKVVVVTDENVSSLYLDIIISKLGDTLENDYSYVVKAGEESKSFETCFELYDFFIINNINRSDVLISLGGGVIGDLTGFVASTYLRGIGLIHVPTSLLAQVDSSVGGKTAVNYRMYKNKVGCFYQPDLVYINYRTLLSLPRKEILNGFVEMIVHSIVNASELFEFLEINYLKILNNSQDVWESLIYWNCKIKAQIIEMDEKDKSIRAYLNFGHTIGHAIESACKYNLSHGVCVAWGI